MIGPAVFAGYYDNPEANAKAFRDGWFRTGDLGHMDEEGFVYITGRASDMYISGGSNIYPREIEEKILTHPAIAEVAVRRRARPDLGRGRRRRLRGARGAKPVSEAELAGVPRAKVPRYKMPKRFFFWEALPKSGYGKVPKRLVRDELEARGLLGERRESRRAPEAMRRIEQPGPPVPERIQWVEARGRAFSFTLQAGAAAAGCGAPRLCRRRVCRRRAEHAGGALGPVRLCDAGAVEDDATCRVLQRHLPARRRRRG